MGDQTDNSISSQARTTPENDINSRLGDLFDCVVLGLTENIDDHTVDSRAITARMIAKQYPDFTNALLSFDLRLAELNVMERIFQLGDVPQAEKDLHDSILNEFRSFTTNFARESFGSTEGFFEWVDSIKQDADKRMLLIENLMQKMSDAAAQLQFEEAAKYRHKIRELKGETQPWDRPDGADERYVNIPAEIVHGLRCREVGLPSSFSKVALQIEKQCPNLTRVLLAFEDIIETLGVIVRLSEGEEVPQTEKDLHDSINRDMLLYIEAFAKKEFGSTEAFLEWWESVK